MAICPICKADKIPERQPGLGGGKLITCRSANCRRLYLNAQNRKGWRKRRDLLRKKAGLLHRCYTCGRHNGFAEADVRSASLYRRSTEGVGSGAGWLRKRPESRPSKALGAVPGASVGLGVQSAGRARLAALGSVPVSGIEPSWNQRASRSPGPSQGSRTGLR